MTKNWRISRRTFLRGGAGALLPLPFLNLMEASGKTAAQRPPMRFMTLFKPNGVHPPSWNINGGTEFDFLDQARHVAGAGTTPRAAAQ